MDSVYSRFISCNGVLNKCITDKVIDKETKALNDLNIIFEHFKQLNVFSGTTLFINEAESRITQYHKNMLEKFVNNGCEIGLHSHLNHPYSFNSDSNTTISNNIEDYIGNGILIPKTNIELFLENINAKQKIIYAYKGGNHIVNDNLLNLLYELNFIIDTSHIHYENNLEYTTKLCFNCNLLEFPEILPNLNSIEQHINNCEQNNDDCYIRLQTHQWDHEMFNPFLSSLINYLNINNKNYKFCSIYTMYENYMLKNNLQQITPIRIKYHFSHTIDTIQKLGDIYDYKMQTFLDETNNVIKYKIGLTQGKCCYLYFTPKLSFINNNSCKNDVNKLSRKPYKITFNIETKCNINKVRFFNGEESILTDVINNSVEIICTINYYNTHDNYPYFEFLYESNEPENEIIIFNPEIETINFNIELCNKFILHSCLKLFNLGNNSFANYYSERIKNNFILDGRDITMCSYILNNINKNAIIIELFAGIGQLSHALNLLGFKNCLINDIDAGRGYISNYINEDLHNSCETIIDNFINIDYKIKNIEYILCVNSVGLYGEHMILFEKYIIEMLNNNLKIIFYNYTSKTLGLEISCLKICLNIVESYKESYKYDIVHNNELIIFQKI